MMNNLARNVSFDEDSYEEFFRLNQPPKTHAEQKRKLEEFCARHDQSGSNNRVVLVTSGGTTVPLEHHTVRFVDNFSLGNRGSASAEYFLDCGYAVLFVHRRRSLQPFVRHLNTDNILEMLRVRRLPAEVGQVDDDVSKIEVIPSQTATWLPILERYESAKTSGRLQSVNFTTLVEYMWLLRAAAEALVPFGNRAFIYLAAAVSDFYVPQQVMSTHKISSDEGVSINLHLVPKMLKPLVRHWVPDAYVVSFKLETDESVVIPKSRGALHNYGHQLVVANLLQSRRSRVIFVGRTTEETVSLSDRDVNEGAEIEELIVRNLINRHDIFLRQGDSSPTPTRMTSNTD